MAQNCSAGAWTSAPDQPCDIRQVNLHVPQFPHQIILQGSGEDFTNVLPVWVCEDHGLLNRELHIFCQLVPPVKILCVRCVCSGAHVYACMRTEGHQRFLSVTFHLNSLEMGLWLNVVQPVSQPGLVTVPPPPSTVPRLQVHASPAGFYRGAGIQTSSSFQYSKCCYPLSHQPSPWLNYLTCD